MRKCKILLFLLPLFLIGCHAGRKVTKVPEPPEPPVVDEVPTPRTYTVLNFEGTVEGYGVKGQMRVAQDSVMWVSVNKILEMGRAMCTSDSLWLHAPLLGQDMALDYPALKKMTGTDITYDKIQEMALAPDADEQIARLAQQLGFHATVHITQRREVESLSFPFTKPIKP